MPYIKCIMFNVQREDVQEIANAYGNEQHFFVIGVCAVRDACTVSVR